MSYKLIAIDLDDTLLNSAGIIPERAVRAVQAAAAEARWWCCAPAGRKGMQRHYDELGLDTLVSRQAAPRCMTHRACAFPRVDPALANRFLNSVTGLACIRRSISAGTRHEKSRYSDYYGPTATPAS